jgi:hypothetical protein
MDAIVEEGRRISVDTLCELDELLVLGWTEERTPNAESMLKWRVHTERTKETHCIVEERKAPAGQRTTNK